VSGAKGAKGGGSGKGGRSPKDVVDAHERGERRDRFVAQFLTGCLARRYRLPSTEEAAKIFEKIPDLDAALADWGKDRPYPGPAPGTTEGLKGKVENVAARLRAQLRSRRGPRGRAGEEA
jgi:hypothetical protein